MQENPPMPLTATRIFDSLLTRILLLGLCLVVAGTAVRYYGLTHFLHKDLSSVVESQQLALANYVARDVDEKIVQRQKLVERLASALPIASLDEPEALRAWLRERYEYQSLFPVGFFVVDVAGVALADFPVLPHRVTISYADRDYVQAALQGRLFVGSPVMGRATKAPVLPIAAPVKNGWGEVSVVLVGVAALADPGFLNSLLQSRIGGTTGGFLLVSPRDKLYVAASQPEMVLQPLPAPGVNVLLDRALSGFRGAETIVSADGSEEVIAIVDVPSTGWFVVARLPGSEAFATVERTRVFLFQGAALTLLVFAVLTSIGLYFVFRHLFRAAEHADSMTLGEKPMEPLPVTRNDEVGHLISAFNRLLVKLNSNQAELARMAHHDALTGLPNRVLFSDRLQQVLAQAKRKETHLALLYLDLDGFKEVNDTFGHEGGDDVLQQVANRLAKTVRAVDTLARIGGDEFVLLMSDLDDHAEEAAGIVATKCIAALKPPFPIGGTTCAIGVSIGIALAQGHCTADKLLLTADHAMYDAKKAGRGQYVFSRLPEKS